MNFIFQLSLLSLVFLSFVMVITIPILLSLPSESGSSKNFLLFGSTSWIVLVFLVGILNSFVI